MKELKFDTPSNTGVKEGTTSKIEQFKSMFI